MSPAHARNEEKETNSVENESSDFHITRNAFCFPHKMLHKLLFSNTLENR